MINELHEFMNRGIISNSLKLPQNPTNLYE